MRQAVTAPDLVVAALAATRHNVTVTIKNIGNAPATEGFWVDVYLNPDPPPSRVNQHWWQLAPQGLVWGVTTPIPVQGTLTLSFNDAFYHPEQSGFSGLIAPGAVVYAQVDSVNLDTIYGGVLESNEQNNIGGPVLSSTTGRMTNPNPAATLKTAAVSGLPSRSASR